MRNNAVCKTGRELSIHTKMGVYFLHSHSSRMCSNQYSLTTLAIIQSEDSRHLNFQNVLPSASHAYMWSLYQRMQDILARQYIYFFLCSYFIVL